MKKPGRWIATFGPSMKVSKVNVEPSPALDLVEVTTVGPGEQVTNIFYFDRLDGAALADALHRALDALERQAVDAAAEAADPEPRFQVALIPETGEPGFEAPGAFAIWDAKNNMVLSNRWAHSPAGHRSALSYADRLDAENGAEVRAITSGR